MSSGSGNTHDLSGNAKPMALAYNPADRNIWFVTPDAKIGRFAPRVPYDSALYEPIYQGMQAEDLVCWDLDVWTYVHGREKGHAVKCPATGGYPPLGTGAPAATHALALGESMSGARLVVATLDGKGALTFIDAKGQVSTSNDYGTPLHGLAIDASNTQDYWVSCPDRHRVVRYDASTGDFDLSPLDFGEHSPRSLALTRTEGKVLWATTPEAGIIRYDFDTKSYRVIGIPAVANRAYALPDGSLWFTMPGGDAVGYFAPGATGLTGTIQTGKGTGPAALAVDADGALWIGLTGTGQMFRVSKFQLSPLSGQGQQAVVGTEFPNPLRAKATRLDGSPVQGATVTFTIKGDQARFEGDRETDTRTTLADGTATSAPLLAKHVGECDISAVWREEGAFARFENITVIPAAGPADHTRYLSGAGQETEHGTDFAEPLKVTVVDANGAPVPSVDVTFRIVDDDLASFEGGPIAVVPSDDTGVAASPVLTAGSEAGRVRVEAWAADTSAGTVFRERIR
ncbi:hypothetical protein I5Q34_08885 [Streptomyces sp. AV19]|uniref:hypothetical protein n=1 Tax=Streptomyces sp. AV19 TaxID=2793068 RepID=UPI0018FEA529|nr:hypothetical protein [Streptomyces sp. AV19]MBH1934401.1 hypothetical protein [Streptomyces sp. AV19]MDG4536255.1 hypothetical protein [Streptomyces sp. AV19]